MIFDTHAHYTSHRFDSDRHALLQSPPQKGVAGVVDCAVDLATAREELALAGQYPFVYAALGIHPESIIEEDTSTRLVFGGDWRAELRAIRPLYEHPKAVAVGECGKFLLCLSECCLLGRFSVLDVTARSADAFR